MKRLWAYLVEKLWTAPEGWCKKHEVPYYRPFKFSDKLWCDECLAESFRKAAEEDRIAADEELRRKARIFAEELKKAGAT